MMDRGGVDRGVPCGSAGWGLQRDAEVTLLEFQDGQVVLLKEFDQRADLREILVCLLGRGGRGGFLGGSLGRLLGGLC